MSLEFNPLLFDGFDLTGSGANPNFISPVATEGDLPATAPSGALIVVQSTDHIYVFDSGFSRWVDTGITPTAVGSTPNPDGYTIQPDASDLIIRTDLILQPADESNPGVITAVDQSFQGYKQFNGNIASPNVNTPTLNDSAISVAMDVDNRSTYDIDGNISIDFQNRLMYDGNDAASIDWQNKVLQDSAGLTSVNWDGRQAFDDSGNASLDWINRHLLDSSGAASVLWDAYQLKIGSDIPLTWGSTGIVASGAVVSDVSPNFAVVTDGSSKLVASSTTATEIGYVSGVTSAIQTQLNGKQPTGNYITALTGDVTASGPGSVAATIANLAVTNAKIANATINLTTKVTGTLPIANGGTNSATTLNNNRVMKSSGSAIVEAAAITAARALISDSNGIPTQSTTTSTELAFVSGVTSAIQTQLDGKANQALSNLSSTAINQDLLPAVTANNALGGPSNLWSSLWTNVVFQLDPSSGNNFISFGSLASPPWTTASLGFRSGGTKPLGMYTVDNGIGDGSPAMPIYIYTGSNTAGTGNSGNLTLATGTSAGGTRGSIIFDAANVNVVNLTASSVVLTDSSKNLVSQAVLPVANGGTGLSAGVQKYFMHAYTASTTFTTDSDSGTGTVWKYTMIGAGGGGGGTNGAAAAGGGGGSGAYAQGYFSGVAGSTGITITVGAGGTAGTTAGANGGTGGSTSIGSPVSVTVTGGSGGGGNTTTVSGGGAGGTVTVGSPQLAIGGNFGRASITAKGGMGSSSQFGDGGDGGTSNIFGTGATPTSYGAGGGGAVGVTAAGGTGGGGVIIIERMTP